VTGSGDKEDDQRLFFFFRFFSALFFLLSSPCTLSLSPLYFFSSSPVSFSSPLYSSPVLSFLFFPIHSSLVFFFSSVFCVISFLSSRIFGFYQCSLFTSILLCLSVSSLISSPPLFASSSLLFALSASRFSFCPR